VKLRAIAPLALAACLATSALASTSATAAVATKADTTTYNLAPAKAGASWLVSQIDNHGLLTSPYMGVEYADYGHSIDAALSLMALGLDAGAQHGFAKALEKNVGKYTGTKGEVYSGATAKLAYFAQQMGDDATDFGGVDLITQLEGTVQASGRIMDQSAYGDYANVFGQIYAAAALGAGGSDLGDAATGFLLDQQCGAGWFRQDFTRDSSGVASDAGCAKGDTPSVDATATFVELFANAKSSAVKAAVKSATSWLNSVQGKDGGFSASGKGAENANSTGLAGWALGLEGKTGSASQAATWVRYLQLADVGSCVLFGKADDGALSYDKTGYKSAVQAGISTDTVAQFRVATAQALPVLAWAPAGDVKIKLPSNPTVAPGSTVKATVTGLAPATPVCGSTSAGSSYALAGKGGSMTVRLLMPKKGSTKATVATPKATASATYKVK
jgi:hypothetical protein